MRNAPATFVLSLALAAGVASAVLAPQPVLANPQWYPLMCRGGVTYTLTVDSVNGTSLLELTFAKNPGAGSSSMAVGSCAWTDRRLNTVEVGMLSILGTTEDQRRVVFPELMGCLRDTGCIVTFSANYDASSNGTGRLDRPVKFSRAKEQAK